MTASSSSSSNPTDQRSAAAKRALWDENVEGLGNVLMHVRQAWYHGDQVVFYTKERERLQKYLPPFYYGMAASAFLFVGFRITGHSGVQQWRRRVWEQWRYGSSSGGGGKSTRGGKMDSSTSPPPRSIPQQQQQPVMGYLETKRITEREKALQSMRLLTDFFVSISVGVSGSLFLLEANKKHMRADFEESPLVAGRSVVADQMCPSLLQLYHNDDAVRAVLEENEVNTQLKDINISSFARFIKNCQKRVDYEKRIRKEKGMSKFEPVLVPYTGL